MFCKISKPKAWRCIMIPHIIKICKSCSDKMFWLELELKNLRALRAIRKLYFEVHYFTENPCILQTKGGLRNWNFIARPPIIMQYYAILDTESTSCWGLRLARVADIWWMIKNLMECFGFVQQKKVQCFPYWQSQNQFSLREEWGS